MEIKTVGDLKRQLQEFQDETGLGDDTPIRVPVKAYTQSHAADAFEISMVSGGYGAVCLWVSLPQGFFIGQRQANNGLQRTQKHRG